MQFLHSPAAVIRNPMFKILKVTGSQWTGKAEPRSDKSEDLLHATNEELVKLNALGESSQRHDEKVFNSIYGTLVRV